MKGRLLPFQIQHIKYKKKKNTKQIQFQFSTSSFTILIISVKETWNNTS